jgi:arsenate reductase-like glutaredoxin family protein
MKLYGLKNCDTCRKALRALADAGREAELVDVRETPLDEATRARFVETFGDRIVNTRSATWRGLSEEERAADPVALLAAHPAVMKRPVIEEDGTLYLGWDAGVRSALL